MTPSPYKLKAYRSTQDGRFYGELVYGTSAVAQLKEGDVTGFKKYQELSEWARLAAVEHKVSISPAESHSIESTFVV